MNFFSISMDVFFTEVQWVQVQSKLKFRTNHVKLENFILSKSFRIKWLSFWINWFIYWQNIHTDNVFKNCRLDFLWKFVQRPVKLKEMKFPRAYPKLGSIALQVEDNLSKGYSPMKVKPDPEIHGPPAWSARTKFSVRWSLSRLLLWLEPFSTKPRNDIWYPSQTYDFLREWPVGFELSSS